MPFTTPEQVSALRQRARQLMNDGKLPRAPRSTFAGEQGQPIPCAVCGLSIRPQVIAYEVEIEVADKKRTLHIAPVAHLVHLVGRHTRYPVPFRPYGAALRELRTAHGSGMSGLQSCPTCGDGSHSLIALTHSGLERSPRALGETFPSAGRKQRSRPELKPPSAAFR